MKIKKENGLFVARFKNFTVIDSSRVGAMVRMALYIGIKK